jgi:hypothetical protein
MKNVDKTITVRDVSSSCDAEFETSESDCISISDMIYPTYEEFLQFLVAHYEVNPDGFSSANIPRYTGGCGQHCEIEDYPTPRNKEKYDKRFSNMVETFKTWDLKDQGYVGAGAYDDLAASRMKRVMNGCIVGATNPGIVAALGTMYTDYRSIRVAGDLIFNIIKTMP